MASEAVGFWLARLPHSRPVSLSTGLHILRHTLCPHLAMQGPMRSVQELVGHRSLTMPQHHRLLPAMTSEWRSEECIQVSDRISRDH